MPHTPCFTSFHLLFQPISASHEFPSSDLLKSQDLAFLFSLIKLPSHFNGDLICKKINFIDQSKLVIPSHAFVHCLTRDNICQDVTLPILLPKTISLKSVSSHFASTFPNLPDSFVLHQNLQLLHQICPLVDLCDKISNNHKVFHYFLSKSLQNSSNTSSSFLFKI